MATQFVRNVGNNVDSLINRAETEIRNELKKKLEEQKNKLPTPDSLIKELQVRANPNACSARGIEKYEKKYNKVLDKLTNIENKLKNAKSRMSTTEENLRQIIEEEGPIGTVKAFKEEIIEPIILPLLKGIIIAVPIALFAIPTPPPGAPGLGGLIPRLSDKLRKAKSKALELSAIIGMIGFMISYYQQKATRILDPLKFLLSKLDFILEQITKFKAFIYSLNLNFEEQCNSLNNAANDSIGNSENPIIPDPTGSSSLQEYLSLLKDQYEDVYNVLLEANNQKAIERIFAIKENLEEDYNVSFKVINL